MEVGKITNVELELSTMTSAIDYPVFLAAFTVRKETYSLAGAGRDSI